MTRKEQIKSAYKQLGSSASFYDGMMTYSTLPGKAVCRLVWNMDGEKNLESVMEELPHLRELKMLHNCLKEMTFVLPL